MPFKKGNKRGRNPGSDFRNVNLKSEIGGDDVPMPDADADADESGYIGDGNNDDSQLIDDAATPADQTELQDDDEDEAADDQTTAADQPSAGHRKAGSRSRQLRVGFDSPDPNDDASDTGTPARRSRGGFRGGGGFRGRPKYGPKPQQSDRGPVDKDGVPLDVIDDEHALPIDQEGDAKVDKEGNLQDARKYRVRTFTIYGRGDRLYMLSTEPARCTGFRDSYLFFAKHINLFKVVLDDEQKRDLISRDIMPNSYKGRSIGVVTARSVFREFGARIIIGGRRVTDDYYAQAARDKGFIEGELADPADRVPTSGELYNSNQYVAWHGASSVYHNNASAIPAANGRPAQTKRRLNITTINWQYEHAKESSKYNTTLAAIRRANIAGQYDAHTNLMLLPKSTQPSHVKWDTVTLEDDTLDHAAVTGFAAVQPVVARNFLVTDTIYSTPAQSNLGIPGADGDTWDTIGCNGVSDIPDELIAELPAECKAALTAAQRAERNWKSQWSTETTDGHRGTLRIGFNGFPV